MSGMATYGFKLYRPCAADCSQCYVHPGLAILPTLLNYISSESVARRDDITLL